MKKVDKSSKKRTYCSQT